MKPPIEFWFDFISPFGFLASQRIEALAARHGRTVDWRPTLLGVTVLKVMGLKPLLDTPLKGDYIRRELARYQRRHGVALKRPLHGPLMNPLPAGRAMAWLRQQQPAQAAAFARAVYDAVWLRAVDVVDTPTLDACAGQAGLPAGLFDGPLADGSAAAALRAEVEAGLARGVFGSPFVIVDGEPFFGVDKLELVEEWLASGGW